MRSTDLFSGVVPFVYTAEERSFRRAAERLGVTSAAISKAVLKLEDDLGVRLLARTSRSVELTPEGERYLVRCREAITSMEAGRRSMTESRALPRGEVHLSMPFILGRLLVPALPAAAARYRISMTDRFVPLIAERVDVALRIGGQQPSSLVSKLLRRTRWITVASPSYLAEHGVPRAVRDLERHNCLRFVGPNGKVREPIFAAASAKGDGPELRGNLLIDQGDHLLDAALVGLGICQALDFMVDDHLEAGRLISVLDDHVAPGPSVFAVTVAERRRAPNVKAMVAFLSEVIGGRGAARDGEPS
jgi:DNA-binding transcriptional LysR family regulator